MTIPVEKTGKRIKVHPAERVLPGALLVLFLSVALHAHGHWGECSVFEMGSKEPPCQACAVMGSAETPVQNPSGIELHKGRGIAFPAAQVIFPAYLPCAPLPPRGPPATSR